MTVTYNTNIPQAAFRAASRAYSHELTLRNYIWSLMAEVQSSLQGTFMKLHKTNNISQKTGRQNHCQTCQQATQVYRIKNKK